MWQNDPCVIDVGRHLTGKGASYAGRTVDFKKLALRLGPEARHEMRALRSTRVNAIEVSSGGILKAIDRLTDMAAKRQATKEMERVGARR